jgi:hypothetical protein
MERLVHALVPGSEPLTAAGGLANGEVRWRAGGRRLTFNPWKRRPYQPPVDGATVNGAVVVVLTGLGFSATGLVGGGRQRRFVPRRLWLRVRGRRLVPLSVAATGRTRHPLGSHSRARPCQRRSLGLRALAGDARVLVLVFRVAGRATGLPDLGPDHRDDRVIGQAPLSRTVIIQDVTKPKLALLHQELPNGTSLAGKRIAKGFAIVAELVSGGNTAAAG